MLRQETDIPFLPRDIYNLYAHFKRIQLHGLAMTDALIDYLKTKNIPHAIKPNDDNRTRYLFIAHPESLELAQAHPDIIIADCTYKTNKFNLPLLHLIGMDFHIYNSTSCRDFQRFSEIFKYFQRFRRLLVVFINLKYSLFNFVSQLNIKLITLNRHHKL